MGVVSRRGCDSINFGVPEMSLSSLRGFRGVRSVVLLTILIIAIVLVNLTKRDIPYNNGRVDVLFMSFLVLWNASLVCIETRSLKAKSSLPFSMALAGFIGGLPVLYIPLLLLLRFLRTYKLPFVIPVFRKGVSQQRAADHDSEENWTLSRSEEVMNYGSLK